MVKPEQHSTIIKMTCVSVALYYIILSNYIIASTLSHAETAYNYCTSPTLTPYTRVGLSETIIIHVHKGEGTTVSANGISSQGCSNKVGL